MVVASPEPHISHLFRRLRRAGVTGVLLHRLPVAGDLSQRLVAAAAAVDQVTPDHRARPSDPAPAVDVDDVVRPDGLVDLVQDRRSLVYLSTCLPSKLRATGHPHRAVVRQQLVGLARTPGAGLVEGQRSRALLPAL